MNYPFYDLSLLLCHITHIIKKNDVIFLFLHDLLNLFINLNLNLKLNFF